MLQYLVILEADTRYNSVKLFRKLAWLRFYDEVKLNKRTLVFKHLQGSCPASMSDLNFNSNFMQTDTEKLVVIVN